MIELWFRDEMVCEVESVRVGDVVDPSGLGDDWYVVAEIRHIKASEFGALFRVVGQLERPSAFERAVRDARKLPPAQRDDIADGMRNELEMIEASPHIARLFSGTPGCEQAWTAILSILSETNPHVARLRYLADKKGIIL